MQDKKIAIMQPYLFPYIGYFQLINAVDIYVFYDDVQWIKGGWINRHSLLQMENSKIATLPVEKHGLCSINQVFFTSNNKYKQEYLNKIINAYKKAPYYKDIYPLIEEVINYEDRNVAHLIAFSIKQLNNLLGINTKCIFSSSIDYNHQLSAQDKIIDITKKLGGNIYINNINGQHLYNKEDFIKAGLTLQFLEKEIEAYTQFKNEFVPYLSIIDVLMFNDIETVQQMVTKGKLV